MVSSTGAVKLCITINLSELSMKTTAKLLKALCIICWLFSIIGCDIRDPEAQFLEGQKYADGDGVPEDKEEALTWFQLAAEQGHASAQFKLGVSYDQGYGVPKDYKESIKWYRLAATIPAGFGIPITTVIDDLMRN